MPKLEADIKAPAFNLPASNGKNVSLEEFNGKKNVVLYFYPKDDTPGCTVEACGLRDRIKDIQSQGAVVLGVSPDSVASHQKFIEKFKLPFLLLSDEQKNLRRLRRVGREKHVREKIYGGSRAARLSSTKKVKLRRSSRKSRRRDTKRKSWRR